MSSLTYYIPIIVVAVVIAAVVWFLFTFIRNLIREKNGETTCLKCKAAAPKTTRYPYLFLIPVSFGDTYSDAENYLRSHMRPIMDKGQIPTGQRACKVEVFDCPRCNNRQVEITDFLQVRGTESAKAYYEFAYESFRPLLEAWENMYNNQRNLNSL